MKKVLFLVATFSAAFCFQTQAIENQQPISTEETQTLACGKCSRSTCGGCELTCRGCKSIVLDNTESNELACGCKGKGKDKNANVTLFACECEALEVEAEQIPV